METRINDFKIEQLEKQVSTLVEKADKLENEFQKYRAEESRRENNRLLSGVIFLGGIILSLISYIWFKLVAGA